MLDEQQDGLGSEMDWNKQMGEKLEFQIRYRGRIRSWRVFLEFIASVRLGGSFQYMDLCTAWSLSLWQQKRNREIFRRLLKKVVVVAEGVRSDDVFQLSGGRVLWWIDHAKRRIQNDAKFSNPTCRLIFCVLKRRLEVSDLVLILLTCPSASVLSWQFMRSVQAGDINQESSINR